MALEAKFPEGSPYAKFTIDVKDPRYVDAHANAERLGLTQAQFSGLLEHEAKRVSARASQPPAAPTPAANALPSNYSKLSTAAKFELALNRAAAKRNGG